MTSTKTLEKFGFPATLIKEYKNWCLLLRPKQVTLGSLVLICKDDATKFSAISSESFQEYSFIIPEIEKNLSQTFHYDKINYLMLMMVDPDVHQHIIPRYSQPAEFNGRQYQDFDWPNMPTLSKVNEMEAEEFLKLKVLLTEKFNSPPLTPACPAGRPPTRGGGFLRKDSLNSSPHVGEAGWGGGKKRFKRVYTTGCFDLFHAGHLNILKKSKEIGDFLLVGVSTDELMEKEKGKRPVIPFEERADIVRSLKFVDEVIPQVDKNKQRIVDQYHIDAITVGDDWKGKYPQVSCEVVYFPYTKKVSSGGLKAKIEEMTAE